MNNLLASYQERLHLQDAFFLKIDHEDAMVAIVYRVTLPSSELILKICSRPKDFFREVYFLKYFAESLPIPRIIQVIQPSIGMDGAILMECLPGHLLNPADLTDTLAFHTGSLLARVHMSPTSGYGDLTHPNSLSPDPRAHFALKFKEGLEECNGHLSQNLLEKCRSYFDRHLDLLVGADGPCIVHRDFRPGNLMICDGHFQGIIDWASACSSFSQEDFCLIEHGEWSIPPAMIKCFLEGYASIRPIPNYNEMMPLLRIGKAVATIGFTIKCKTWENKHARIYQFNRRFLDAFF